MPRPKKIVQKESELEQVTEVLEPATVEVLAEEVSIPITDIQSTSDARQDDFVLKMLDYKKDGFFIEIGSGKGIDGSNSYRLELNGWKGLRVDLSEHEQNESRTSKLIIGNALEINYIKELRALKAPSCIDYASLDIDESTTELLNVFPFDKYKFKIITIEHDSYANEGKFVNDQREILEKLGYRLVGKDVLVDTWISWNRAPFEDWWVLPEFFDPELLEKINSTECTGTDIINKFDAQPEDVSVQPMTEPEQENITAMDSTKTLFRVYHLGNFVTEVEENSDILNRFLECNRIQLYTNIEKLKTPTNDQEDLVLFNIPMSDNRKYNSLHQYYQQNGLAPQPPRIADWMTYYKIKYPMATDEEIAIQVFGPLDYSFEIAN